MNRNLDRTRTINGMGPHFLQMTVVSLLKNTGMEETFSPVPAPAAPDPSISKSSAHPLGQSLRLTAAVGRT